MLKVHLTGHDKYYGLIDVIRLWFDGSVEDKESSEILCPAGPDIRIESILQEDGSSICRTDDGRVYKPLGTPLEPGREIKRSLYLAMKDITGREAAWGCLTGIRPTLVAMEADSEEVLIRDYYVRPDKAHLAMETAKEEMRLLDLIPEEDISIYVGIPFCPSRCTYCSFISEDITKHMDRLAYYEQALEKEIRLLSPRINRNIASLYIGGGTPTVLEDKEFASLLDCVMSSFRLAKGTEITVEAGRPDTLTDYKLEVMRSHGINRICINPQTMNSATLARLNRKHTAEDVRYWYGKASGMGFSVINMDLIAGLPGETTEDLLSSVRSLIGLDPKNITIHTLYKKRRANISKAEVMDRGGERKGIDEALQEAYGLLHKAGYHPYYMYRQKDTEKGLENTGFAKGDTGCLYNVAMMTDYRDVLSFGAGSSSKRCFRQEGPDSKRRVERCSTIKDALGYIARFEEMARKKADFFGF